MHEDASTAPAPKRWPEATLENYRLGMNYMDSFEFPEANEKLREAIAESPEHSKSHVALAYVLLWQMKPEQALAEIEKAEARPEGLSEQDRGMLPLLRAKASHDYEESYRLALALRKRFPENRRIAFEVADYDYHTGHYARAFSVLDGLARQNTNDALVWRHAGWAAYEAGDDAKTNAFFKGWREAFPHPEAYVASADAALAQGDASTAKSLIENLTWRYPEVTSNPSAAIITFWSTLEVEGRSAAEALLPTLLPQFQHGYWAYHGQSARAAEAFGDEKTTMAQAAIALARAVGGSPASTVLASLPLGVRYDVQQGIHAIAAALLANSPDTARKLIPTSPELQHEQYEELIEAYELWQADRPREAAERLEKARSRFHSLREHHVFYSYLAGRLALANDDPKAAIVEFEHVMRTRRTVGQFAILHSVSLYWLGRAYESAGDRDSALASYERLAKIWSEADPTQTEAVDLRKRLKVLRHSH
jgi:Tfp pilus assembly protein PilF